MNNKLLFEKIELNDPLKIVKEVFNNIGDSLTFSKSVKDLLSKERVGIDYDGCRFPNDLDESEIYHDYGGKPFEGVECWIMDEEVIVSEEEFFKVLKEACKRYMELHPDKKDELEQIMAQSTFI